MNDLNVQLGTQIAQQLRDSSESSQEPLPVPQTLWDLLLSLDVLPVAGTAMLRSTAVRIQDYLGKPPVELSLNEVQESRDGFRRFLVQRKYSENSIRTHVSNMRRLLNIATERGWLFAECIPDAWKLVLEAAKEKNCFKVAKYVSRLRRSPSLVSEADVESWIDKQVQDGGTYSWVVTKRKLFWQLLIDLRATKHTPSFRWRDKRYGVPLQSLPSPLRDEVEELLRWKQAAYSEDRPKDQRHRPVTAKRLKFMFSSLYGFALNVAGRSDITSVAGLIQKKIVVGYIEWCSNERGVKGQTLQRNLRMIPAAVRHHPDHREVDVTWFGPLLDAVPVEDEAEIKERKAKKYLEYEVLEKIPGILRSQRAASAKRGASHLGLLVMDELLIRWIVALPWRQKNLRECRVGGLSPNILKAAIPVFSDLDLPDWVKRELVRDPAKQFWQFKFSKEETKMKKTIHSLLPRPLIAPLEEFLTQHRADVIGDSDADTLFVNSAGRPLGQMQMSDRVSNIVLRYGGRRVTPHAFRDIVAYTWLKAHPQDYLTVSKLLWHTNINTTIRIYGSRFNESSGVRAMETWLEERAAKAAEPRLAA